MTAEPSYCSDQGWTLDTLKTLMDERDRRYGELASAKQQAIEAALNAADKAVMVSEKNAEKWRDNANEWRQAMTDRERNFLPRNVGYIIGALTVLTLIFGIVDKLGMAR